MNIKLLFLCQILSLLPTSLVFAAGEERSCFDKFQDCMTVAEFDYKVCYETAQATVDSYYFTRCDYISSGGENTDKLLNDCTDKATDFGHEMMDKCNDKFESDLLDCFNDKVDCDEEKSQTQPGPSPLYTPSGSESNPLPYGSN